jgi:hypothetical protein
MPSGVQSITIPAPVGGWNRRDSLGTMDPSDAVVMDNFISTGGLVKLRRGFKTVIKTPPTSYMRDYPIETICSYTAGLEDQMIFSSRVLGSKYTELYKVDENITSFESIIPKDEDGEPLIKLEGTRWKDLQFQNNLFLVSNGVDIPLRYDGTELHAASFTHDSTDHLDLDEITDIASYNKRLFFIQKGTLNLWFTSQMGVISGNIECNDLSDYASRGGELVEIEEWTRTGANDLSSMLVAITSEGEVFMFSGMDPTDAESWKMEGIYQIPSPIGFHCATKMMDDLVFATKGGYYTAAALTSVKETTKEMAITDKIRGAIESLRNYFDDDGWQVVFLQAYNYLFINIPVSETGAEQFVYNLENKTWSKFTGIDAFSFCTFKDKIYFGGKTGNIYELFSTGTDNGIFIGGVIQQAFSTFNIPQKKWIKSVSINIGTPFKQELKLRLACDFNIQPECSVWTEGVSPTEKFAEWDKSLWNKELWGVYTSADMLNIQELETPVDGEVARYISLSLKTVIGSPEEFDMVWHSTTFAYETALQ